jgi:RNA polymerase sigma factor (sigma-70 family)
LEAEARIVQHIKNKQIELAVTAITNAYHEMLYWHIRKLVKHHDAANDALQNTYVRIFKGLANFKHKSSVKTWCYRIAYNESIRLLEQQQKLRYSDNSDAVTDYFEYLTADPYFDLDSASHALHESLSKLSEKQQRVFQMKYFDELTFEEIAEITSWNTNSIKTAFYAAKEKVTVHVMQTL